MLRSTEYCSSKGFSKLSGLVTDVITETPFLLVTVMSSFYTLHVIPHCSVEFLWYLVTMKSIVFICRTFLFWKFVYLLLVHVNSPKRFQPNNSFPGVSSERKVNSDNRKFSLEYNLKKKSGISYLPWEMVKYIYMFLKEN